MSASCTIATWNVNSVKARLPHLLQWLQTTQPDVVLLQEIKCETENFPTLELTAAGYHATAVGQKSYNGVAILSKTPVTVTANALPGDPDDTQARYLEAQWQDLTIAALYVPNGNPVGEIPAESEKYTYKLRWLARLEQHVQRLLASERPFLLGGDFNIIPRAEDVYNPAGWTQDALYRPETRAAWRRLCNLGLTDAFRASHPDTPHAYSFWDYQQGAWPQDHGLRIDHFLLAPEVADRLQDCRIDRTPRGWDKASDHTPVLVALDL